MDLLRQIGTFFGWLTGVLAGLAATLYAFGFLATVAHNRLLGVNWFETSRDPATYLEVGSRIAASWLLVGTVALVAVALLVTAWRMSLGLVGWLLPDRQRQGRLGRIVLAQTPWLAALACVGLLWLIRWIFDGALNLDGLLFAAPATLCDEGTVAQSEIIVSDSLELRRRANGIFLLSALFFICGAFAALAARAEPRPLLPLTVCAIAAVNALGAVPVAHGLFVQPTDRPAAQVTVDLPLALPEAGLRMIAVTRDGYWLWDPAVRDVHWIASAQVRHLRMSPPMRLREIDCTAK